jgi:hypothetical protein
MYISSSIIHPWLLVVLLYVTMWYHVFPTIFPTCFHGFLPTHVTNPELQPPWPPCSLRPSPDAPVASRAKAAISPASAWQWRRTLPSDRRWNYMEVYGDMDRSWNIHIYIANIANKRMWFTWHDLSNKLKLDEFVHLMIAYLPRKNLFHQQKNGGCNLWGDLDPKHTISGHARQPNGTSDWNLSFERLRVNLQMGM